MKDSYYVKQDLLKYKKELEIKIKNSEGQEYFENFYGGELRGINMAIDFIDGYLYYKDDMLFNK